MKRSDFVLLQEEEKKETLLHQGVLIAKRNYPLGKVFLFQLANYYVEMFCNLQNRKVEEYRSFDDTKLLNPYLQAIAVDDLFT